MPTSTPPASNSFAMAATFGKPPLADKTEYFNGSAVAVSAAGDVTITLTRGDVPVVTLYATLTAAKMLNDALGTALSFVENATGVKVPSIADTANALQSKAPPMP